MNGERVIPHGQVGLRGCLPYGRQTGHGHEKAVGEQVQGGIRQGNEETEGRGPGPARGRGHGPVHRSASALAGGQGQGRTGGVPMFLSTSWGVDVSGFRLAVVGALRPAGGVRRPFPCGPVQATRAGSW